jgi:hypothetical protein
MRDILLPRDGAFPFLQRAQPRGFSMEPRLISPVMASAVSYELEENGLLEDLVEQEPTVDLEWRGMKFTNALWRSLNATVTQIEESDRDQLSMFSVRVFQPGLHGTTVHRNHPLIGPWAIGITLSGVAPFNVYDQYQLDEGEVTPLFGDEYDPEPKETMEAGPGSAWALYTANEFIPHSSGIVDSAEQRELLIFYGIH